MAHIVTLRILVDKPDEVRVIDGVNEMLRAAQAPVDEDNGDGPWIVDWSLDSVDPVSEDLNDSMANETYDEGDAFRDWVIFSRSESLRHDGDGFWSNEYGWTTLDLADKYSSVQHDMPYSAGNDAMMMLAPYRMNLYRLRVLEDYQLNGDLAETIVMFECWAEDYGHAEEQAKSAYPGCKVLGFRCAWI